MCLSKAESTSSEVPVSTSTLTGYYIDPEILTYPPQHQWQVATGWDLRNPRALHSNNFGFVSAHDFVRDETAIALIGDSYVESSMLAASDRLNSFIGNML